MFNRRELFCAAVVAPLVAAMTKASPPPAGKFVGWNNSHPPRTIFVDSVRGNDLIGGGTIADPYRTLERAGKFAVNGDAIQVRDMDERDGGSVVTYWPIKSKLRLPKGMLRS